MAPASKRTELPGSHTMHTLARVVTLAATLILAAVPVMAANPAASSASYQLTYVMQPDGKRIVVRWNPCRSHTYKVNLAAVPAKSRSVVLKETHSAVKTMAAKTGMSFTYRGLTGEVPRVGSAAKQTADVIIAYTTPSKTNYPLAGSTTGFGGASIVRTSRPAGSTVYTTAIVKGFLVIDTPDMLRILKPGFGAGMSRGNLLEHELGHVAGLGHPNNASLLMNPRMDWRTPNGYAAGDRAGLAKVGRSAGCLNGF